MTNVVNIIYPYPKNDTWVFDDEDRGLKAEPFVFGSSEIITILTKWKLGMLGKEKFKLIFSVHPLPESHAKLLKLAKDAFSGAWYIVEANNRFLNNMKGWLCPALLKYFEDYPDEIYVYAEEIKDKDKWPNGMYELQKRLSD